MLSPLKPSRRANMEPKRRRNCVDMVKGIIYKITHTKAARRSFDLEAQTPIRSPSTQKIRKVFASSDSSQTRVAPTPQVQHVTSSASTALPREVESQNDAHPSATTDVSPQLQHEEPVGPDVHHQATNVKSGSLPKPGRKTASRVRFSVPEPGLSPKQKDRILKNAAAATNDQQSSPGDQPKKEKKKGKKKKGSGKKSSKKSTSQPGNSKAPPRSENGPGAKGPSSKDGTRVSELLHELKYSLQWFRLVQRMVLTEGTDDYNLAFYCSPFSMLYMVHHGWIQLSEAIAWRHARELLGKGMVLYMLSQKEPSPRPWDIALRSIYARPREEEVKAFQHGWQLGVSERKRYDWDEEAASRDEYGPFGREVLRYAPPIKQEAVLRTLLDPSSDIEKVKFDGNWKPLFGSLLRRKRAFQSTPIPPSPEVPRHCARHENQGEKLTITTTATTTTTANTTATSSSTEEQKGPKRKFQTTVEDADDEDSSERRSEESRRYTREEKGKWKAKSPRLDTETSPAPQPSRSRPEIPVVPPKSPPASTVQGVSSLNASNRDSAAPSNTQVSPSVNAPSSKSPVSPNAQASSLVNPSVVGSASSVLPTEQQAGPSWLSQSQVDQIETRTNHTSIPADVSMDGITETEPCSSIGFPVAPQATEQDSDMSVEYIEPPQIQASQASLQFPLPSANPGFIGLEHGKRLKMDPTPDWQMSLQELPTVQTGWQAQAGQQPALAAQQLTLLGQPTASPVAPKYPERRVKQVPLRARGVQAPQMTPIPDDEPETEPQAGGTTEVEMDSPAQAQPTPVAAQNAPAAGSGTTDSAGNLPLWQVKRQIRKEQRAQEKRERFTKRRD